MVGYVPAPLHRSMSPIGAGVPPSGAHPSGSAQSMPSLTHAELHGRACMSTTATIPRSRLGQELSQVIEAAGGEAFGAESVVRVAATARWSVHNQ